MINLSNYITEISKLYATGIAREHAYRPALQRLIEQLQPDLTVVNEPKRIDCGAPDFGLIRRDIPIGYVEAKDVTENIDDKKHNEQFQRYLDAGFNLIITDYTRFKFYRAGGELVDDIRIGNILPSGLFGSKNQITPVTENFEKFINRLTDFIGWSGAPIRTAKDLSKIMAGKARLIANIIEQALKSDKQSYENNSLHTMLEVFKVSLLPDIKESEFADIYAQTITYGMFAGRLQDNTKEDFSRQEAADLIPKSNPFLKKLFGYIAGTEFDERIAWAVDDLAKLFLASNMTKIMANFGKVKKTTDPIVHFYEDFLADYNPKQRKARGVWYTPEPVVDYIVRAVDTILKNDFGLLAGIADSSKISYKPNDTKTPARTVHKVQLLDPATGTGTFLANVIKKIYDYQVERGQEGIWNSYVGNDLLPRIHGFEILMASYAMAHLKLDMILSDTGYKFDSSNRLGVYLTNSLEEGVKDYNKLIFAEWLSSEAREASAIKTDTPVMVVIGNPPYSVSSSNKGKWINDLLDTYKKDLNERNIQPLSDDYIKFIRLAHNYIDKNGNGVFAYISNNSYLDGVIHRQMRKSLLDSFDRIYIVNLHGNSRINEVNPNGDKDQNVFDIMQGVAISIFIKNDSIEKKGVCYKDVWGSRTDKYNWLSTNNLNDADFIKIMPIAPNYFMAPKDFSSREKYEKGFNIDELFQINTTGIKTHNDNELISFIPFQTEFNHPILYRPFDNRYINYDLKKVLRHRFSIMKNMLEANVSLVAARQFSGGKHFTAFISNKLTEISSQPYASWVVFPLYIYDGLGNRVPNLNPEILNQITEKLGFNPEPQDLFDYIYAVLHSPKYREKYKEFLKIDFPRVPYPNDQIEFERLVKIGRRLREIHLMTVIPSTETKYPVSGTNQVDYVKFTPATDHEPAKVFINDIQYFGNVPEIAWNFFVGGYQPAQKWLKDRKGRVLSYSDIQHYQNIISILLETDKIMQDI